MKKIVTKKAPAPGGHYSQAVEHNGFLFVSGQVPIDPVMNTKLTGEIEVQTLQVLENLKNILEAANSDINKLVKVNIYISDIALWDKVNEIYAEFMGDHKPARAIIPSRDLHYGFKIEVEAIATVGK